MEYIRLFEEFSDKDLENAVKPLVDWDEVDFLQYKLTEYEDAGKFVRMDLCIKKLTGKEDNEFEYTYFYKYSNGDGEYRIVYNSHVISNYVAAIKERGIYYRIYIHEAADDKNGQNTIDMMNQFMEDVKEKFPDALIEDEFLGKSVILKSNPNVSRETNEKD